ncbi:uncharacterized protein FIBRA_08630 [Fibroporia radiculosa]|uniref:Tat pathway signal sequence n=1 Tax=Fibroporia radiculosa TaxID=599839 RepID=J4I326_9APHY|nr:uncharacterized protein FIBRA_08630 [Fibroporia radiculosa]CCM06372.1 predicted protein [Fibroporia radiculosa]
MFLPHAKYIRITQSDPHDSAEKLIVQPADVDNNDLCKCGCHCSTSRCSSWLWLAITAAFSIVALAAILKLTRHPSDAQCAKRLSTYSPALEAVAYHSVDFNGSFRFPSEYRGAPSPAIDAAWDYITMRPGVLRIAPEDLDKLGKPVTPSLVRFQDADGGGYMGSVKFTHQLHCLNTLRMYSYREYYDGRVPMFDARPETVRTHVDHCIEMLRQTLMCHADTGLLTYDWVVGHSTQYPDFNTRHVCRDFPRLLRWVYDHQAHIPERRVMRLEDNVDLEGEP